MASGHRALLTAILLGLLISLADFVHGDGDGPTQCPWRTLGAGYLETCPASANEAVGPTTLEVDSAWSYPPHCVQPDRRTDKHSSRYCIYTYLNLHRGNGISLLTSPDVAQALVSSGTLPPLVPHRSSAFQHALSARNPLYEIKEIPGRGMGMLAGRKIGQWDPVMVDFPSIFVRLDFTEALGPDQMKDLLFRAITQLPEHQQREAMSLARSTGLDPPIMDILKTNVFGIDLNGIPHAGLFLNASRINHNCNPNVYWILDSSTLSQRVIALRDIEPGEEITYSYSPIGSTYQERQEILLRDWGFHCGCKLCSASSADILKSDARRLRLREIESMFDSDEHLDKKQVGHLLEELLFIVKKEGLQPRLSRSYQSAVKAYLRIGDFANARRYLELSEDAWIRFGGKQHPNVDIIRQLWAELRDKESRDNRVRGRTS